MSLSSLYCYLHLVEAVGDGLAGCPLLLLEVQHLLHALAELLPAALQQGGAGGHQENPGHLVQHQGGYNGFKVTWIWEREMVVSAVGLTCLVGPLHSAWFCFLWLVWFSACRWVSHLKVSSDWVSTTLRLVPPPLGRPPNTWRGPGCPCGAPSGRGNLG